MTKKTFFIICLLLFFGLAFSYDLKFFRNIDINTLEFFEGIRTKFLNRFFYFFTELGSKNFIIPISVVALIFLAVKKKYFEASFLMLAFLGEVGLNHLLKGWIHRERPSLNPLIHESGFSFPSGHSMGAIVVFGFFFYLFIHILKMGQKYRYVWLTATIVLVLFIAMSRAYLGVHYPTDIIAGLSAGYVYLYIIILLYHLSSKRRPHSTK
ncbi:phosphatase PAP2 family protein [Lederbergia citri]|uniref:Phosphatase PAP2 family protein n=1 Tax=Lederbergia citri TaxID=2833580 RepID=A0A942TDZ9_9BACI|nr:phosphatase PAP2 family protein [Lederbergia citri]MBS4196125.1 phosphatase PAP2 family protein [Lederbergia citri]